MARFLDIVPGASAWITLLLLILLSWKLPGWVVVFIVLYDLFWFLKVLYLFFHLNTSFIALRRNLKVDWRRRLMETRAGRWERLQHLVIFPMYHEPYEVVERSLSSLARVNYPLERLLVVVATEERGGDDDRETGERIRERFTGVFGGLLVTSHPANIEGELPGKGSNETWAAREAKARLIDTAGIPYDDVIVSVFDIDTQVGADYFGILTESFLAAPHPLRSSYQPTPFFVNNVDTIPLFARLIGFSASFWQLMQQGRPEQLVTFSSHSIPLSALVDVGFWRTDIVSEDSNIFFQCLLHYKGDWRAVPIIYPIYMDAVSGGNFFKALANLYRQQRRWAWGVENFSIVVGDFFRRTDIPRRVKWFWTTRIFDGFYSWSTSSFIIFLFGWLPNLMGGDMFRTTILSYNLPRLTGFLIDLSWIGIVTSALLSIILLPRTDPPRRWYGYLIYLAQWFFMPFTFIIFGSIPALEAQTRMMLGGRFRLGFWKTPKAAAATHA